MGPGRRDLLGQREKGEKARAPQFGFAAPLFMKDDKTSSHKEDEYGQRSTKDQSPPIDARHSSNNNEDVQEPLDTEHGFCRGDDSEDLGENLDGLLLAKKLSELEVANAELEQRLLRMRADYDNFRRRSRQEKQENIIRANEELIAELLPVLDNFHRALHAQNDGDGESIRSGVELLYRQFFEILGSKGLEPIKTVGEVFDPHLHDAVGIEETCDPKQDNQIVEELQKGYLFGDRVLRAAVVKVAKIQN